MSILLAISWFIFSSYWITSSLKAKRKAKRLKFNPLYVLKIRYLVLIVVLLELTTHTKQILFQRFNLPSAVAMSGILILLIGIATAVYARYYLGRDWSSEPSIVENHKLIQKGPYKHIRHPIYLGLILGLVGSFMIGIHFWGILLIYFGCLYIYKIGVEEKLLDNKFPRHYSEYKKHTWALIPFVY
jgi:protein-S-isoprenylcysteine O-methyltransferase Ste14